MNSTNLRRIDGGQKIKQADRSSTFVFRLLDENRKPMKGLDGLEADIRLIAGEIVIYAVTKTIAEDTLSFTIEQALPAGVYTVEVSAGGYVFPSDRSVTLEVTQGSTKYELKELVPMDIQEMTEKLKTFEQKVQGLKNYDDTALKSSVSDLTTRLANLSNYDDNELRERIRGVSEGLKGLSDTVSAIKPYDDQEIKSSIQGMQTALEEFSGRLRGLVDNDTIYDDSELRERIRALTERVSAIVVPPAYDDQAIREKLEVVNQKLTTLENRQDRDTVYDDSQVLAEIATIKRELSAIGSSGNGEPYDDREIKAKIQDLEQRLTNLPTSGVSAEVVDDKINIAKIEMNNEFSGKFATWGSLGDAKKEAKDELKQELLANPEFRGPKGDPGEPGKDGERGHDIGINIHYTSDDGLDTVVEFTDGNTVNIKNGLDGKDGKSAYQIAQSNGFTGDEVAWLKSLKGADGQSAVIDSKTAINSNSNIRPSASGSSHIHFNSTEEFLFYAPYRQYIQIPAANILTEPLVQGETYTASFVTSKAVTRLAYYPNASRGYIEALREEIGEAYLYTVTFEAPTEGHLKSHLYAEAHNGLISTFRLDKGAKSKAFNDLERLQHKVSTIKASLTSGVDHDLQTKILKLSHVESGIAKTNTNGYPFTEERIVFDWPFDGIPDISLMPVYTSSSTAFANYAIYDLDNTGFRIRTNRSDSVVTTRWVARETKF